MAKGMYLLLSPDEMIINMDQNEGIKARTMFKKEICSGTTIEDNRRSMDYWVFEEKPSKIQSCNTQGGKGNEEVNCSTL
ncbi:hypothetical protein P9597_11120 [Aneurinibacillus migulanus]|uniref:hypothetical protein n=1 Tax=Aneurinibacillus migulanus TaxID=47500 RepID=UPI002E229EB7|nr:hypothetical protein [Aneurinibacillus migulanus]